MPLDIDNIEAAIDPEIQDRVRRATEMLHARIVAAAPERSGVLKRDIKTRFSKDGLTGHVETKAKHAHLVEYGFRHVGGTFVAANPFMRKTLIDADEAISAILEEPIE